MMSRNIDRQRSNRSHHHPYSRSRSPRQHRYHRSPPHAPSRAPGDAYTHKPWRKRSRSRSPELLKLPYDALQVHKRDYTEYKALFALYLDVQKQLVLEDLPEEEVKGRWKSFVRKWNRGELAEGWYDHSTKLKAEHEASTTHRYEEQANQRSSASVNRNGQQGQLISKEADDESDDGAFGPSLPGARSTGRSAGPAIPTIEDLELQREMALEDQSAARTELANSRKLDRKEQKERLDELASRAAPGTRERQLEKKRELNEKMRSFRDKSPGAVEEIKESDLMGDDGIDAYKVKKKEFERKKNERELRKEEVLRARAAEREERLREHRAKEEKTVAMLKALAKQNFG